MVYFNEPNKPATLTKVAEFYGDLEKTLEKFSKKVEPLIGIIGNTIKFGLYEIQPQPYLLITSKQVNEQLTKYGYNLILTITSDSPGFNNNIEKRFIEKTGIRLKDAPEFLSQGMMNLGMAFDIFKENGEKAMEVLRIINKPSREE